MSEQQFRTFVDLIQFDQETQQVQQDLSATEDEKAALEKKKGQLDRVLADAKSNVTTLKKEVDAAELAMKELDELEREKKKRLDEVSSPREYKSIQGELEAVNRKRHVLEEQLIDLWNKYETAQKYYKTQQEECSRNMEELEKTIGEKNTILTDLIAKIEQREKDRSELEKELPEEWLEKYAAMRMRVTNPVVPVVGESCSGCFYPIPRQDLLMLQANRLVQCRSCYRLLYIEEEKAEEKEEKAE